jgi:hypothetical protein
MTKRVNEGTTCYLQVDLKDKANVVQAPNSVTYRIDCLTTGTVVRADTSVAPAASIEIVLTPADTAIHDPTNEIEEKRVAGRAVYGVNDAVTFEFFYSVRRMSPLPA